MLTSQHLWTSQDPASKGYNLLRLKEISLYRDWLFSMAQRSVPPIVPLLGCFYWEQLEAEVPVLAAGVPNLWQSRHKWQKELCFLHRNLCVSSFRDTALRSDGWARTAEHSSLGSTVVCCLQWLRQLLLAASSWRIRPRFSTELWQRDPSHEYAHI